MKHYFAQHDHDEGVELVQLLEITEGTQDKQTTVSSPWGTKTGNLGTLFLGSSVFWAGIWLAFVLPHYLLALPVFLLGLLTASGAIDPLIPQFIKGSPVPKYKLTDGYVLFGSDRILQTSGPLAHYEGAIDALVDDLNYMFEHDKTEAWDILVAAWNVREVKGSDEAAQAQQEALHSRLGEVLKASREVRDAEKDFLNDQTVNRALISTDDY